MNEFPSKIKVTGIDGSGKTSVVKKLGSVIGTGSSVGVMSSLREPAYIISRKNKQILFPNVTHRIAAVLDHGERRQNSLILLSAAVGYIFLQGRIIEPTMKKKGVDIVLSDRDRLVDSIVMFLEYVGLNLPMRLMTVAIEALGGQSSTDQLFLLNVSVSTALERIKQRGFFDVHEEKKRLERMSLNYPPVIQSMMALGKVKQWQQIDTENNSIDEVSQRIYKYL